MRIKINSLNISEQKGTIKQPVPAVEITGDGLAGDAHAGQWHRQVSLLGIESLRKAAEQNGRNYKYGDFGENITTEGFELYKANILDRFTSGNVVLEVTQIGKKCHKGCEIMNISGNCIMPVEGIFCRVLQPGQLRQGDELKYVPRQLKVKVVTLSDRAFNQVYDDKSGPMAVGLLTDFFTNGNRWVSYEREVIPDDAPMLENLLREAVAADTDIIVTTGGTGIGQRDITPEVVHKVIDREIPGIMELVRFKYGSENPRALLSRSVAGVAGKSLVYALPGNPKAVKEYLSEITKTIEHSLRMINGVDFH